VRDMKKKKKRGPVFGLLYGIILTAFTAYALLDTFVIPRTYAVVSSQASTVSTTAVSGGTVTASSKTSDSSSSSSSASDASSATASSASDSSESSSSSEESSTASSDPVVTDTTYSDGNISITITTERYENTNVYVADVTLSSAEYLKTALAQGTYGRNVTETTSAIASEVNAILAINGDFYGSQETGYVIRDGQLLRSESAGSDQEDLVIYSDGTFGIIKEGDITAEQLLADGAVQVLSFGPALVENGEVSVSSDEEVGKAMASNPRTAIGIIDSLHYVFVVSDGRTSESEGLSLSQLASFMQGLGVQTAYNLDGGGSSTMVFEGTVVNRPTTNGSTIKERSVSDIVYIGE
jgi:exopolysaccharide biosynthesis protein